MIAQKSHGNARGQLSPQEGANIFPLRALRGSVVNPHQNQKSSSIPNFPFKPFQGVPRRSKPFQAIYRKKRLFIFSCSTSINPCTPPSPGQPFCPFCHSVKNLWIPSVSLCLCGKTYEKSGSSDRFPTAANQKTCSLKYEIH